MLKIYDGRKEFFQWDLNQKLIVEDNTITEVHFCNRSDDCSLVCEVYKENGLNVVNVPNILLQDSWTIKAYAYCNDCYTKQAAAFKVNARTKPTDYVYTETEVRTWAGMEADLQEALTGLEAKIEEELIAVNNKVDAELVDIALAVNEDIAEIKQGLAADVEEINNSLDNRIEEKTKEFASTGYVNNTFANAVKGNKEGAVISIGDASPVEHELKVNVKRKNIIDLVKIIGADYTNTIDGGFVFIENGVAIFSGDLKPTTNSGWRNLLECKDLPQHKYIIPAGTYTTANNLTLQIREMNTFTNGLEGGNKSGTFTISKPMWLSGFYIAFFGEQALNAVIPLLVVEGTETPTAYTPYIEDLSAVKVEKCGKNLFNSDSTQIKLLTHPINESGTTETRYGYELRLPAGKYTLSVSRVGSDIFSNYIYIYISDKNGNFRSDAKWFLDGKQKKDAYIITDTIIHRPTLLDLNYGDIVYIIDTQAREDLLEKGIENFARYYFQLEQGTTNTDYEPYKGEEHPVNADGTAEGVTSLSPNITLLTDTEGAIINCEYNRDLNTVINELYNAILSIGG